MGSIGRYIFRAVLGSFLLVLISLTTAVWITQALRDFDIVTSQGQTVLAFIIITGMIIPLLIQVITPIALVIAAVHLLNKLNSDSEIIVMNGAGMNPWRIFRPFAAATAVVTLMLFGVSAYLSPAGLRELQTRIIELRTDLVSNIVQPGRFMSIERGLSFHIRERRPNGLLVGILVDDRRDPKERVTILAERGEIIKNQTSSVLVLENGSIQRHEAKQRDPNIVSFQRYGFDLSKFSSSPTIKYSVRERYLWQLIWPENTDAVFVEQAGQIWAELNDRILGMLYPFAFVVLVFAFLGVPRTTRQSSTWSIVGVIVSVGVLRMIGFAGTVLTVSHPAIAVLQYLVVGGAIFAGLFAISRGLIIEPPKTLTNLGDAAVEWFVKRFGIARERTT